MASIIRRSARLGMRRPSPISFSKTRFRSRSFPSFKRWKLVMNPIERLPDLDWNEIARQEIVVTGADLVAKSDFAFQIGRVAIAGLIYHNYISPPWFWFALAKGVTIRDLIDFR